MLIQRIQAIQLRLRLATEVKKSQSELEQPAKVYQVDAVEVKVDTVLDQLDTILKRTNGLVTSHQLQIIKEGLEKDIVENVKDIHAEYRPKFQRTEWLYKIVIGETISLLATAIIVIFLTKG